jgi:antitoxin (DNA-binding transcriptional repressor) of toxin-antitoxin stability system
LTAVETAGETFLVTRGGRVVARIEPAAGTSGAAVKALLRHYPSDAGRGARAGRGPLPADRAGSNVARLILDSTILITAVRTGKALNRLIRR